MSLPIAHSCFGLALGILRFVPKCGSLKEALQHVWQRRVELFVCMLIANAPDIDFLFGIFTGNLNRYHQMGTHTLGWALLAAFCIWLYGRFALKNHPCFTFWFVFLLLAGHLIFDIFTADTTPPCGIMFAWPISDAYWHSPISIFPAAAKKTAGDIISMHNLRNTAWEALISLPVVAAALLWKVRRRRPA